MGEGVLSDFTNHEDSSIYMAGYMLQLISQLKQLLQKEHDMHIL